MQPLNPFLRAFFASRFPSQCYPTEQYVLLVPTTELLVTSKDQESQAPYTDFVASDDFLASHVVRITSSLGAGTSKDALALRENKGKARQYATLDGRLVVIKDVFVYTNKGFKTLTQAQLLQDEVYYTNTAEASQWLIYYISRPLLGTPEPLVPRNGLTTVPAPPFGSKLVITGADPATVQKPQQTNIKMFGELLNQFPIIARQMQPGLEKLFAQFKNELEKPLPELPTLSASSTVVDRDSSRPSSSASFPSAATPLALSRSSTGQSSMFTSDQDLIRNAAETLVTSAIDLFQAVDKQQLSVLAAATNLSGPVVERMIERYVMEQVHDRLLFPHVCAAYVDEDERLAKCRAQMACVDISQIGLTDDDGASHKRQLSRRVAAGVEAFKKMGVAGSPEEMIQVLLDTEKRVTSAIPEDHPYPGIQGSGTGKPAAFAINADTLVSLLLIVIIRCPVRHLHSRLAYMRDFSFVEDVESGEVGYALSTYEAVLAYISHNSRGLRKISRANNALWNAVKKGNLQAVKVSLDLTDNPGDSGDNPDDSAVAGVADDSPDEGVRFSTANGNVKNASLEQISDQNETHLAHVYPWKKSAVSSNTKGTKMKRVSMDTRSLSNSSIRSGLSKISTAGSLKSVMSGEVRPEQLCQTEDVEGNSILMMAVDHNQAGVLEFLLSLEDMFPPETVLCDCNDEGTTLLSAAVQNGKMKVIAVIAAYLVANTSDTQTVIKYLSYQDSKGRCAAHYLFNAPYLIEQFGALVPWRLRDKNGQTPLFATFRSYDNEAYQEIIEMAMAAATKYQGDNEKLHLDDHIDAKNNSLLHVVHDPKIIRQLLYQCDADANAVNDRRFTPLMVASKFARVDVVRTLFGDPRVDLQARDLRGLTAIELAKDDDVRNRIDDMLLLSGMPTKEDRKTMIVRSFFIDDGSLRLVVKSGARNSNATITVTTCRRSLGDFENLSKWLALEHPASWMPSILRLRSPFQLPSKPSRHMLRDIQLRLENFLQTLLSHPTFSTHEMLWEFILVPDIDITMLADRARRKAQARIDRLQEEYEPLLDGVTEVELFVTHARDQVHSVHQAYRSILCQVAALRNIASDIFEAHRHVATLVTQLRFVSDQHQAAMTRYAGTLAQTEYSPTTRFYYTINSTLSNSNALLHSLSRPITLIRSITTAHSNISKHHTSASRSQRWPSAFGLLDETRQARERESLEKVMATEEEIKRLGSELRYTQQTVATELAGWQESHGRVVKQEITEWARKMVVVERARLEGMRRALRRLKNDGSGGATTGAAAAAPAT